MHILFDYKLSTPRKLEDSNTEKQIEVVVPLKHLRNVLGTLYKPLINCEINIVLAWYELCNNKQSNKRC